jgi:hypothetical protein
MSESLDPLRIWIDYISNVSRRFVSSQQPNGLVYTEISIITLIYRVDHSIPDSIVTDLFRIPTFL